MSSEWVEPLMGFEENHRSIATNDGKEGIVLRVQIVRLKSERLRQ